MKSVIIKGCLPDSRVEHGLVPDYCEVWPLNKQPVLPKRWDRYFQLHGVSHMIERHGLEYVNWLESQDKPVYVFKDQMEKLEENPNIRPYPLEEVIQLGGRAYLTGSFAYMIALATLEGFEEIEFAGVDMLYSNGPHEPTEAFAIPCMEYWLGIAHARGMRIREPIPNGIFMNPWKDLAETHEGLYGLDPKVGGE